MLYGGYTEGTNRFLQFGSTSAGTVVTVKGCRINKSSNADGVLIEGLGGSFNGGTSDSDSANRDSTPRPPAILFLRVASTSFLMSSRGYFRGINTNLNGLFFSSCR